MEFEIRHFDTPLLRFTGDPESAANTIKVTWVNEPFRYLLPIGLDISDKGVLSWIGHRTIPKNRAFVSTFLARNGLNANRTLGIILVCKGLSLNDCYWVVPPDNKQQFAKVNLYDNPMSRLLAQIAFTGHGSGVRSSFCSSPEFTTNGMLPKCWRRISGHIYLWKGGTTGFANSGFEPFSEYYSSDLAKAIGMNCVDYQLHAWKKTLCSSCELFTSKEYSFVPMANLAKSGGFPAVKDYYAAKGGAYWQAFSDMLAFDALICNTDRHLNNFGFMVENETNQIIAPAPLFDHGNALFYQAYGDDWSSLGSLGLYAEAQTPCIYGDFFADVKECMTHETRIKVRKALDFTFSRKPIKGFPAKRLRLIEEMINQRAARLLK